MVPLHDAASNLVYAGAGHAVVATLCDGRVLMEGGVVPGEAEVLERAGAAARELVQRATGAKG
jgi:5-methylthioadenosine/S-adenosylhomocysteine deaminase